MLARSGQAGRDTAALTFDDIKAVETMDRPHHLRRDDCADSDLYAVAKLQQLGLPFAGSVLVIDDQPRACPCCKNLIFAADDQTPKHYKLFTWQHHQARCMGDGRNGQAHDVTKLAIKRLAFCNHDPGGSLCRDKDVELEPNNIRPDGTRPADIRRRGTGGGARDINMDVTIGTATRESCLSKATKSSDAVLLKREGAKWDDDKRSSYPLQNSATQTFIPLALNHFGRRGPHFNALLNQFASQLISRPGGCRLLSGPFA